MKNNRLLQLIFGFFLMAATLGIYAQEVLTGGNLENEADWTAMWRTNASDQGTITFNYTDDVPAQGADGCLRITGYGQGGAYVFQEVTLTPRHTYALDCAFKNISTDDINNTWVEFILSKTAPVESADYGVGDGDYRAMMNTWIAPDTLDFDGLVSERFEFKYDDSELQDMAGFTLVPTEAATTWYMVIKVGCWNTAGETVPTYDFLFDNITLVDLGADNSFSADQLLDGEVTDAADYTCDVTMTWDADSVYMDFVITDDVIHTAESDVWNNDNVEIYFDMDNSKNPTWPRNAGWPASSYDTNDYQLRIVPDVAWDVNNAIGGVRQVYEVTDTGYQFTVNIAWDSLLVDFNAAAGTQIGFDILASDNDGDGRNQLTWNAPTTMPWNDASLFGTVELLEGGAFLVILDEEAPGVPDVAAEVDEEGEVTLTWSAVTDNIAVLSYRIVLDNKGLITKYATVAEGQESFSVDTLVPGTYMFKVVAIDNSGNTATSAAVEAVVEADAVDSHEAVEFAVYPNPSDGLVYISTDVASDINLSVYTLSGELIAHHTFVSDYVLDMSNLAPGMYILRMETKGKLNVQRIVIE